MEHWQNGTGSAKSNLDMVVHCGNGIRIMEYVIVIISKKSSARCWWNVLFVSIDNNRRPSVYNNLDSN